MPNKMSKKSGKWLPNIRGDYCYVCSECGFGIPNTIAWIDCNRASDERETAVDLPGFANYCPFCGTKMTCVSHRCNDSEAHDSVKQEENSSVKICPFERSAAAIGGGECIKEMCAWWSAERQSCVVFAPILEAEESLKKEIRTVLDADVIVQGGEY